MNEILPEVIIFEWDKGNKEKNNKKHSVLNEEAEQCFVNEPAVLLNDDGHSKLERRYLLLGKSDNDRLLSTIFTIRKGKIRIISTRAMSRKERKLYEKT